FGAASLVRWLSGMESGWAERPIVRRRSVVDDPQAVMRRLLASLVLALALPATAHAAVRVSAFYYPWYGNMARDGLFRHWGQHGHTPPNDIASAYYPLRGLYSSSDWLITGEQMQDLRDAGVDEVAVSWWGQGSPEDTRLPEVIAAAHAHGLS